MNKHAPLPIGAAVLVAAALATAAPAGAQNWTVSGQTAGLTVGGSFTGLSLTCVTRGRVELAFSGFPAHLPTGGAYTVPVSVDGTAFLFEAQARDGGSRDFSNLVHAAPMAELTTLLDALAQGRAAEVSSPAGRYVVPLAGSGRAVETFRQRCG
ncbi:hypothetical protein [Aurantimonas endophytica]|uniref:Uncharacterized protein n=1 Tax=Aurantimonas endophytica TaxID=1522175 RepID=A0A7W6HHL2_9HYPH|nr:hypothetical protein [Aurantimonas endophytica]MBB4005336.1 hypothetical protein [Aurantimonas endophytica]MCO6406003.1 hypothetical protein [Aurantimonas endophytica]